MGIKRLNAITMIDNNIIAISTIAPASHFNSSRFSRINRSSGFSANIYSRMSPPIILSNFLAVVGHNNLVVESEMDDFGGVKMVVGVV